VAVYIVRFVVVYSVCLTVRLDRNQRPSVCEADFSGCVFSIVATIGDISAMRAQRLMVKFYDACREAAENLPESVN
jgi:hypothetical protein